jgi:cbb3-type cytochrome c oxidase subunit III
MDEKRERSLAQNLFVNLRVLAVLTVVFLVLLALAPLKWHNTEWRDAQKEYNRRATATGMRPMSIGLQQIWRPEVGLTDRCTSCHVGMGAAPPLDDGGSLFEAHTEVGHEVARMGCTICHRGQGRATTEEAAHGNVAHWEDPMLPTDFVEASCGTCHGDAARVPELPQVERGAYLFELHGCLACHIVDGTGGIVGPDLSGVALKGFDRAWHIRHLREPTSMVEGSQMMSFGHLTDPEIDDLLAYMDTLIGAPKLIRGKAIAVELGCRGCHKIGGLGGDVGEALESTGTRALGDYDFSGVTGPHTLENWQREHLRDPQRVAPGSKMPAYILSPIDEDALITYILSVRETELPLEELPRGTILARLQERRDFAPDGRSLFRAFCSACHGPDGRGQVMPTLGTTVPDLRNPDTHAVISPATLRFTVENGRPGRDMPAWAASGAGLKDSEIDAILDFLRDGLPSPPTFEEVRTASADRGLGAQIFSNDCASCHGPDGSGTDIAPSLINPEFLFVADDRFVYSTVTLGRAGTAMPAHPELDAKAVKSLIGWIRAQGAVAVARGDTRSRQMRQIVRDALGVRQLENYRASGSPAYGKTLFDSMCVNCHGDNGRGNLGPAIANPAFLKVASDGFLAGTILLGRSERPMRAFGPHGLVQLEGREVGDLIVYLRRLASEPVPKPGYRTAQGTASHGKELYGQYCVGCHGEEGSGRTAPALRNAGFLDSVTDGFLQATIVRGRAGTAMRAWARGGYGFEELAPRDINDIVAYIRSWQTE